ncbi:MAG: YncE family protein [Cyclobacteriaceae bacterium]|nr:YncE family protein [Cyclobacteriaceae bacterium]
MKKFTFSPFAVFLILASLLLQFCQQKKDTVWIAVPPAFDRYTVIDSAGQTVLPNGRIISPAGNTFRVAPHPYGLTLSADGNIAVTANSGTSPLSITIIKDILTDSPKIMQVPPGPATEKGILASVFMGLAISPDNQVVYVAGGQENKVYIFSIDTGAKLDSIDCSYKDDIIDHTHGYIGDMAMTKDGSTIYAVDQINFRVIVLDTQLKRLTHSIPVGRYPFGIILSPDEKKVYVANVGMYQYSAIPGITEENVAEMGLKFPPLGYGTKEAEEGIHNDSTNIPGLGPQNTPEAFSVFTIDVSDKDNPTVTAQKQHRTPGWRHG